MNLSQSSMEKTAKKVLKKQEKRNEKRAEERKRRRAERKRKQESLIKYRESNPLPEPVFEYPEDTGSQVQPENRGFMAKFKRFFRRASD